MKKILFVTLVTFTISIILSSCASHPVRMSGKKERVQNLKKVALIEMIVAPHAKPRYPLIDAAIFKSSLDNIASEIINFNIQCVDTFETYLATSFKDYFKPEIVYGKELRKSVEYSKLKDSISIETLALDDDDFPKINVPEGTLNFFNFYEKGHPLYYFSTKQIGKEKEKISKICNTLNIDGAIIAVTGVEALEPAGILNSSWVRVNATKLYFFDKSGDYILFLKGNSEENISSADDFFNYKKMMNDYYSNVRLMFDVLFGLKENSR